ncbi:MAG TPA: sulfur carrier protein ThiS [Firmicutes bacterium]|nr:sulfur carrier protein ThiS [Bacillota bacterium]
MMKINGKTVPWSAPISLSQWLQENGYGQGRVAVERNGEIIPKSQYDTVILREGDCLEIVHFVGGG